MSEQNNGQTVKIIGFEEFSQELGHERGLSQEGKSLITCSCGWRCHFGWQLGIQIEDWQEHVVTELAKQLNHNPICFPYDGRAYSCSCGGWEEYYYPIDKEPGLSSSDWARTVWIKHALKIIIEWARRQKNIDYIKWPRFHDHFD